MAQRRMFSQRIVGDENFLEMPMSSQNLYFHLGIYADDDGFVNPQKIIRMIGANPDDLKVVVAKGFVIPFKNGVVVITNWKENNYIQKDRYTPTIYQEQYNELSCVQNVYKLDTQVRLGKVRLGKVRGEETHPTPLKEIKYLKRGEITDSVMDEIAQRYEVPADFVRDCWDTAQNWLDAKGKVQKDYKAFLSNWVKRERADWILKNKRGRGGVVDARTK